MKPLLPLLALLLLGGCQTEPQAALTPEQQQARNAEHEAIRQERAQQEYWESERGQP